MSAAGVPHRPYIFFSFFLSLYYPRPAYGNRPYKYDKSIITLCGSDKRERERERKIRADPKRIRVSLADEPRRLIPTKLIETRCFGQKLGLSRTRARSVSLSLSFSLSIHRLCCYCDSNCDQSTKNCLRVPTKNSLLTSPGNIAVMPCGKRAHTREKSIYGPSGEREKLPSRREDIPRDTAGPVTFRRNGKLGSFPRGEKVSPREVGHRRVGHHRHLLIFP